MAAFSIDGGLATSLNCCSHLFTSVHICSPICFDVARTQIVTASKDGTAKVCVLRSFVLAEIGICNLVYRLRCGGLTTASVPCTELHSRQMVQTCTDEGQFFAVFEVSELWMDTKLGCDGPPFSQDATEAWRKRQ